MGKTLTTEEFIQRARKVHGDKYDYSLVKYQAYSKSVNIICPIHGIFSQCAGEHLRGSGCYACGKKALLKSLDYYVPIFRELYGDKYDYTESVYNGSHSKIKVKCNLCGSIFYISPDNHAHGVGCKYCKLGSDRRNHCFEGEIWKSVKGFEDFYMVSNMGRVKSLPRLSGNSRYITEEKILSPRVCGTQREYLSVALHANGVRRQMKIHRLVAEAFIPNPNGYKEINHKDENKGNNCVENLEWCSRSYNINYGSGKEKRRKSVIKAVNAYDMAGNKVKEFDSIVAASEFAKVSATNISRACKLNRMSGGYIWKYKDSDE